MYGERDTNVTFQGSEGGPCCWPAGASGDTHIRERDVQRSKVFDPESGVTKGTECPRAQVGRHTVTVRNSLMGCVWASRGKLGSEEGVAGPHRPASHRERGGAGPGRQMFRRRLPTPTRSLFTGPACGGSPVAGGMPGPPGARKSGLWRQLFAAVGWEPPLPGDRRPGPKKAAEKAPVPAEAEQAGSPSCWEKGARVPAGPRPR